MYQGKNKTALCSQKNIAESFVSILREKEYSKISISEICQKAGVSRQTFYSLFESKENIVAFILKKEYEMEFPKEFDGFSLPTVKQLSENFCDYIVEENEFLELLAKNRILFLMKFSLYDSFVKYGKRIENDNENFSDLRADFIAAGLAVIAKHYVMNRDKISEERLRELIYELFSGSYFPEDTDTSY